MTQHDEQLTIPAPDPADLMYELTCLVPLRALMNGAIYMQPDGRALSRFFGRGPGGQYHEDNRILPTAHEALAFQRAVMCAYVGLPRLPIDIIDLTVEARDSIYCSLDELSKRL